jgi:pimeloyl-ACP methyl ester carboxylesterase
MRLTRANLYKVRRTKIREPKWMRGADRRDYDEASMRPRTMLGILALTGAHLAAGCKHPPPAVPTTDAKVIDGLVDAGGVALHIHCVGRGEPGVIFEAGLGNDGTVWRDVQTEVGHFSQACAYDRAGLGYSGEARKPRTSRHIVNELHSLLANAGLEAPYVLVGHSFGGLNVRLYAIDHPGDVAGLVLVDAMTENVDSRYWALVPRDKMRELQKGLSTLPDGVDFEGLRESMAQVRASPKSLGAIPLVVLTRGKDLPEYGLPSDVAARTFRAWGEMQAELPRLSSNGIQVVAKSSGHFIQWDAPKLVIAAIREVVDAARAGSRLEVGKLSTLADRTD